MSQSQSNVERSESTRYRKSGRSNQQRQFSGPGSIKGGGGSSAPSNRSFKNYNTQGGQSVARNPNASPDSSAPSAAHAVHYGTHQRQLAHVVSTTTDVKLTDTSTQKVNRAVPRVPSNVSTASPTSNASTASSDSKSPTRPAKAPGDASNPFLLQFGSISPGFMNAMQVPARTSSAPPNLDEQKRDQALRDSLRAAPAISTPSVLEPQLPKKDAGVLDQPNTVAPVPVCELKRDAQVSAAPPVTQTQKPFGLPAPRMTVPMLFNQPQASVQYGELNPQMHSQVMSGMSLPMPMSMPIPLPMGNPSVQQPMFVSGLQPHPIHSSGVMHQGQLNFSSQLSQLHPQLGNMGINMAPQFQPQQGGKFSGTRKTVKITHPKTHEELILSGSSAPRSHAANHSMNFYPNSYNVDSIYLPAQSTAPLNSSQLPPTQLPWFSNQVTVKPASGSYGEKDIVPSTISSIGMSESLKQRQHGEDSVRSEKKAGPSSSSYLQQPKPALGTSSTMTHRISKHSARVSGPITVESETSSTSTYDSVPNAASALTSISFVEEAKNEVAVVSDPRKLGNGGLKDEVGRQSSSFPTYLSEPEPLEAKGTLLRSSVMLEKAKDSPSATISDAGGTSDLRSDSAEEATQNFATKTANGRQIKPEARDKIELGELISPESSEPDNCGLETSLKSVSLESLEIINKIEESSEVSFSSQDGDLLEIAQKKMEESSGFRSDDDRVSDNLVRSTFMSDGQNAESPALVIGLSAQYDKTSVSDASLRVPDSMDTKKVTATGSAMVDQGSEPNSVSSPPECVLESDNEGSENIGSCMLPSQSGVKEKVLSEHNAATSTVPRSKKKLKELCRKAEAAGTSSDLYMAYKGPEEKKETVTSAENRETTSSTSDKKKTVNMTQDNGTLCDRPAQSNAEPDDWEDVADISTPKLETLKNEKQVNDEDGFGLMAKKYSRDFLQKFAEQCTDLPEVFEITSDLADALMVSIVNDSHGPYPSSGRNVDRPNGGYRPDRRGIGMGDEDKWGRFLGPHVSGRGEMRMDIGCAVNVMGLRPSQGINYGVLRNPRVQTPGQYTGGILSGPMQSLPPQGGLQRNNSDSDRWQRGTAFQKGLMPSPQTPMQVMHKAEKKYEIGKINDEEEAKQRKLKSILNKLTPQNFEKLFEQVKQVNIDNVVTLSGVIAQIFDKALTEPTFCEMYANFCFHLAAELPDLSVDNERITFKRLLLNKCQEEFERGEKEEEEANKADEEGEAKQSEEEREEKRLRARRRMLGNIRLIGELYKKKMLTEKIMHECIRKLLGQYQNPDEENVEALCKLMSTIGEMIDHSRAKEYIDAYFDRMLQLSNNMKLSSRVRFMLKDAIDLRKNKWQQRRKVEGPKKIEEVHRDAAQERQAQTSRLSRAPSFGTSNRRGPPMELSPRGPGMLSSPSSQIGVYRAVSPHARSYGSQDVRLEERHSFENRMSVPLPQRLVGHDTVTLGPQGGLARGMASRGLPPAPSIPLAEMASSGDSRRIGPGLNGFSSMPERSAYGQREDHMPRYLPDKFTSPSMYDQSHPQERNMSHGNRDVMHKDRGFDRSLPTSPTTLGAPPTLMPNVSSEEMYDEEHLRDKSLSKIKEFYSANDENEVAFCIKDLNASSFYPTMISIWVTDSFERKGMERDLLTKLLINLTKSRSNMISQDQLIEGFEAVLASLEDTIHDAPKAAEFLGRIFAKVILENVISFSEIGKLIYDGGEERGQLVETGLAAEVLGSILETIKTEKDDSVLNEIRSNSNLQLENFRPPGSNKSSRIDKFI
ncbi:eukaryotic translation initiation factor 4G-like isoform X2 [Olea europaea subsp. europaea]|uniref:Eukaryotic translation initiation factor 4G n=1 Tax=Olea europaea subsp. europaea TaxID=158383 RepID=A0A8S0R3I2_OLEEU|nr:eukaryotic translation initiation factor 4G-like isoform X2 [Olea europaea subsp. europaea]